MPVMRPLFRFVPLMLAATLMAACSDRLNTPLEPSFGKSGGSTTALTVTSTSPAAAQRDTTLDVQVIGTGFDNGSLATFQLQGTLDPRVQSTRRSS